MDLHAVVTALAERVAKLEAARPRKTSYNQWEAAREVGISVKKFREEMRVGRIKGVLNGRRWLFRDDELQRFLRGEDPP
jgi:hypothetical protein